MTNFIAYAICIYIIIYYISSEHYILYWTYTERRRQRYEIHIPLCVLIQPAAFYSPQPHALMKIYSRKLRFLIISGLVCVCVFVSWLTFLWEVKMPLARTKDRRVCLKCIENIFVMFRERCISQICCTI